MLWGGEAQEPGCCCRAGPGLSALQAWALEAKGRGEGWGAGPPRFYCHLWQVCRLKLPGPSGRGAVPGARGWEEWDPEATACTTFKVSSRKSACVCRTPSPFFTKVPELRIRTPGTPHSLSPPDHTPRLSLSLSPAAPPPCSPLLPGNLHVCFAAGFGGPARKGVFDQQASRPSPLPLLCVPPETPVPACTVAGELPSRCCMLCRELMTEY